MQSSPRPRLLEVLYSFNVGGSELLGLELASQLQESGIDVLCTALQGISGPLAHRCIARGIEIVDLGLPKHGLFTRNGLSLDLIRRLRELELDAIHLQHFLGLNKMGLAANIAGIPRVVVTEHSLLDVSQSFAGKLRIRLNWRLADTITTIHPQITDYLISKLGVKSERVITVPVGIEVQRWHRTDRAERRLDFGYGAEDFVFAFVGRFAAVKNVPGLVEAFLEYQSRTPLPSRLVLVGDGADMATCLRIADRHPAGSRIRFAGELDDARPVLAAADAFVMNSTSEGTPRSLLEAMAMGLPCVCPAVGGIPSILASRGWLFPSQDSVALIDALLAVSRNPAESRLIGERGRDFVVDNFDSRRICDQYRSLLFPGISNDFAQRRGDV